MMEIKAGQYWIDGMPHKHWVGIKIVDVSGQMVTYHGVDPNGEHHTHNTVGIRDVISFLTKTNSYLSKSDNFKVIYDILNSSES